MKKIEFMGKRDDRKMSAKMATIVVESETGLVPVRDQIILLNKIYMGDEHLENNKTYISELNRKRSGYMQQDKKCKIYHVDYFIDFDSMVMKLVASKLKCHYCERDCLFLYNETGDNKQWTLDRIDNNLGHTDANTVICCLKCNVARGSINHDRFLESKQIRTIRKLG